MKPHRRWPRLSRLAAFAGLVRWLIFGGPTGCTMALGDYVIRDATADCWLVYDAIDERAAECGVAWTRELMCTTVIHEAVAPHACLEALRTCECGDLPTAWSQSCRGLFDRSPL